MNRPPLARPPIHLNLAASRVLRMVIVLLAVAALAALLLSSLPRHLLLPVPALAALAWWHAGKDLPLRLVLRSDGTALQLDAEGRAQPVQCLALHERGPLGSLSLCRAGRRCNVPWAADTLPRALRRDLRLWMRDHVRPPESPAPNRKPSATSSHSPTGPTTSPPG